MIMIILLVDDFPPLFFLLLLFLLLSGYNIAWILNGSIFTTKGLYLYRITFSWELRAHWPFVE